MLSLSCGGRGNPIRTRPYSPPRARRSRTLERVTWRLGKGVLTLAGVAAISALVAACGGIDGDDMAGPVQPAKPEDFPQPKGRSLADLRRKLGGEGPSLVAAVSQFERGANRFGFALFDRARAQIADAPVGIYVAPADGGAAHGPFVARYESLEVEPQYQSRSVASDPDAAQSLYVAQLELPKAGRYDILGVARLDGRLVTATSAGAGLTVRSAAAVPDVGDRAPVIHTPTAAEVGGDIRRIDTRDPPSSMHEVDFADVVGREPAILLFATPELCKSRVCGPVVDVAEQVKAERGDEVRFVHQEIYTDNEVEKGFRPQVLAWRLPTEPWAFAVDRSGRVAARLEGAFSAVELERAVDAALKR